MTTVRKSAAERQRDIVKTTRRLRSEPSQDGLSFSPAIMAMGLDSREPPNEPRAPRDPAKTRLSAEPWTGVDTKQEGERHDG